MAAPWYDPNMFGAWFGAIAGGVGGTLCGLLGGLAGALAPRGLGKTLVVGAWVAFIILGVGLLGFGLYALAMGQPYAIWFFPTMSGLVYAGVMGGLLPIVLKRYREAEERRMEAESIRNT